MGECLEELYWSDRLDPVIRFYSHFRNPQELILWMKGRHRGILRVEVREGDGEIAVVIPTPNLQGERAERARRLFRGFLTILVESRGRMFSYAVSVNAGVKEALRWNPRWIVVSNDDVLQVEGLGEVRERTESLNHKREAIIYAREGRYHSYWVHLVKVNRSFPHLMRLYGLISGDKRIWVQGLLRTKYGEKLRAELESIPHFMLGRLSALSLALAGERKCDFLNFGSFGIFSRGTVREGELMDPTFINSHEDVELSLRVRERLISNLRVVEEIGGSLGFSELRFARIFANSVYMSWLGRTVDLCLNWRDQRVERI